MAAKVLFWCFFCEFKSASLGSVSSSDSASSPDATSQENHDLSIPEVYLVAAGQRCAAAEQRCTFAGQDYCSPVDKAKLLVKQAEWVCVDNPEASEQEQSSKRSWRRIDDSQPVWPMALLVSTISLCACICSATCYCRHRNSEQLPKLGHKSLRCTTPKDWPTSSAQLSGHQLPEQLPKPPQTHISRHVGTINDDCQSCGSGKGSGFSRSSSKNSSHSQAPPPPAPNPCPPPGSPSYIRRPDIPSVAERAQQARRRAASEEIGDSGRPGTPLRSPLETSPLQTGDIWRPSSAPCGRTAWNSDSAGSKDPRWQAAFAEGQSIPRSKSCADHQQRGLGERNVRRNSVNTESSRWADTPGRTRHAEHTTWSQSERREPASSQNEDGGFARPSNSSGRTDSGNSRSRSCTAPLVGDGGDPPPAELVDFLRDLRNRPAEERRRLFKDQCRAWHPDKNVGDEARATRIFQHLQQERKQILGDGV